MVWLIILFLLFAGLHFMLLLPAQLGIVVAAVATVILWVVWKLKWVILGIIGLEEIFGGRDDNT
ncbi:MAG TPA: hypothetical protein VN809_13540 [Telmatospirillum sp.]|nr:hypothetical protein [Telmatospirillum sp.]